MSKNECEKLFATEHWQGDLKISCCCAFFLVFANRDYLKASYNDEHCIWEVVGIREVPDFSTLEGDNEFYYKYAQYNREDDKEIGWMLSYEVLKNNILNIYFSSGLKVSLIYDCESESESIELST